MRDLEQLRNHCRRMAEMTEPEIVTEILDGVPTSVVVAGVPSPEDRALWQQIATELDVYLAPEHPHPEDLALFNDRRNP